MVKKKLLTSLLCGTLILGEFSATGINAFAAPATGIEEISVSAQDDSSVTAAPKLTQAPAVTDDEDELTGSFEVVDDKIDGDYATYAAAVQEALNHVDDDMTSLELVTALHDYIVSSVHYEYKDPDKKAEPGTDEYNHYTAYSCLVGKETVCNGYSSALKYLLNMVGIPCECVVSDSKSNTNPDGMNHQWNEVQIGENWYEVDPTWDDSSLIDDKANKTQFEESAGQVLRNYYLKSTSYFKSGDDNHTAHTGYTPTYACTATDLDDLFSGYNSSIIKVADNKYFYNDKGVLYMTSDMTAKGRAVAAPESGTPFSSDEGSSNYGVLFYKNGLLYFNDTFSFYSYDWNNEDLNLVFGGEDQNFPFIYGAVETDTGFTVMGKNEAEDTTVTEIGTITSDTGSASIPLSKDPIIVASNAYSYTPASDENIRNGVLQLGNPEVLSVIVTPWNATVDRNVTWTSSDESIATVTNGYVDAKKCGTVTITATVADKSVSTEITVINTLTGFNITKDNLKDGTLNLTTGEDYTIQSTYTAVSDLDATSDDMNIIWSSDNTGVATVDENGTIVAVGAGTATITGQMGIFKDTVKVNVNAVGSFPDVPSNKYYAPAVKWAVSKGITKGTSATTFSPDNTCNRSQVVTFLWRSVGSPAPTSGDCPFTDLTAGSYYYDAVLWAYQNGITTGKTATTFDPMGHVTRGEFVTLLFRSKKASAVEASNPFTDVAAGKYYYNAVLWAYQNNITRGKGNNLFDPSGICSRAEVVTFIYRAKDL